MLQRRNENAPTLGDPIKLGRSGSLLELDDDLDAGGHVLIREIKGDFSLSRNSTRPQNQEGKGDGGGFHEVHRVKSGALVSLTGFLRK